MTLLLRSAPPAVAGPDAVPGADLAAVVAACLLAVLLGFVLSRPLARRRHVLLPDMTAVEAERLAWVSATGRSAVAVSVVPGVRADTAPGPALGEGGADLAELLEDDHPISRPGRHRRPSPFWRLRPRRGHGPVLLEGPDSEDHSYTPWLGRTDGAASRRPGPTPAREVSWLPPERELGWEEEPDGGAVAEDVRDLRRAPEPSGQAAVAAPMARSAVPPTQTPGPIATPVPVPAAAPVDPPSFDGVHGSDGVHGADGADGADGASAEDGGEESALPTSRRARRHAEQRRRRRLPRLRLPRTHRAATADVDPQTGADADPDRDPEVDPEVGPEVDANVDTHAGAHTDAHGDAHTDAHGDAHGDAHTDRRIDPTSDPATAVTSDATLDPALDPATGATVTPAPLQAEPQVQVDSLGVFEPMPRRKRTPGHPSAPAPTSSPLSVFSRPAAEPARSHAQPPQPHVEPGRLAEPSPAAPELPQPADDTSALADALAQTLARLEPGTGSQAAAPGAWQVPAPEPAERPRSGRRAAGRRAASADPVTAEIPVVAYEAAAGSGSVPAGAAEGDRSAGAVRDRFSPNVLAPAVPVQRDGTSPSPAQRRLLRSAARRLAEAVDRAEVARAATEEAAALTDAEWSALILRSVEGPRVLWAHPEGATPTEIWGLSTLTALLAQPRPVRELLPGDPLAGGRTTSLLSVPVPSGGAMVGCLLVRRREAVSFDAAQEDGLTRLGRMTGKALLTLSQRGALEPTVSGDDVTGLPGADKLRQDLQAALRTASTYGMTATLVTIDVEGLAELRSQLGPRPADETLTVVSAALTRTLRVGDVPYRIGPARFGALLPATPAEQAARVGERVASAATAALAAADVHPAARSLHLRPRTVAVETSPDAVMAAVDPRLRAGRVTGR